MCFHANHTIMAPGDHLGLVEKINNLDDSGIRVDNKGKLQLTRVLPSSLHPLPASLIPKPLLSLLQSYNSGKLGGLPSTRRHTAMCRLRRYRLIPPANRTSRAHMSAEEKRVYNRTYLRDWRHKHACKSVST